MSAFTNNRILVVAAHSDDEALGCGGTIAVHRARGDEVRVLFMTDGVSARADLPDDAKRREASQRRKASGEALAHLGVDDFINLDFPDNQMDTLSLLVIAQAIETQVVDFLPHIIYTHHGGDLNVDHRCVHEAVMTACRPQPGHCVNTILAFEVMSSTEWRSPVVGNAFLPNWFVDIAAHVDAKQAALQAYSAEMRDWPHSRSVEAIDALIRHRGATMGLLAAEAFMCLRHIITN